MTIDNKEREHLMDFILGDLTFTIKNKKHRQDLKDVLGGEEEIRALEDFLKDRMEEETEFFLDVADIYK